MSKSTRRKNSDKDKTLTLTVLADIDGYTLIAIPNTESNGVDDPTHFFTWMRNPEGKSSFNIETFAENLTSLDAIVSECPDLADIASETHAMAISGLAAAPANLLGDMPTADIVGRFQYALDLAIAEVIGSDCLTHETLTEVYDSLDVLDLYANDFQGLEKRNQTFILLTNLLTQWAETQANAEYVLDAADAALEDFLDTLYLMFPAGHNEITVFTDNETETISIERSENIKGWDEYPEDDESEYDTEYDDNNDNILQELLDNDDVYNWDEGLYEILYEYENEDEDTEEDPPYGTEGDESLFNRATMYGYFFGGHLIIRTATNRFYDDGTQIVITYGYHLSDRMIKPLSEGEVFDICCTDATNGSPIPPEHGVEYMDAPTIN